MPLRFENPSAYQRTADNRPITSSKGGCSRYESVRTSRQHSCGQGSTLCERLPRPRVERFPGALDHVEIHEQRGQLLRRRVVQIERQTPTFVIL